MLPDMSASWSHVAASNFKDLLRAGLCVFEVRTPRSFICDVANV